MEPFIQHQGLVAPLNRDNVDTDAIIPAQFMKSILRTGFGPNLFDEWRYLDPGSPGQRTDERQENPDFVLNLPRYRSATILLTKKNFGCGSSREHAPWALRQFGFRAIIASSFADIFFNNCCKNGLLPVVLDAGAIDDLFIETERAPGYRLDVDLGARRVVTPGGHSYEFRIEEFQRECLLAGVDDIDLTLKKRELIRAFELGRLKLRPWL